MEILGADFQHERPSGSRTDWLQEKLLTAERNVWGKTRFKRRMMRFLPLTRKQPRQNMKRIALSILPLFAISAEADPLPSET